MKINPYYTIDRVPVESGALPFEFAVCGQNGVICQFNSVYTAALVARFFSGASLRIHEKDSVLMALNRYDEQIAKRGDNQDGKAIK